MLAPAGMPFTLADMVAALAAVFSGDEALRGFGRDVEAFSGQKHVFFFSSGRAAMSCGLTALQALHPQRDEVLLPAYTSYSVPSAVVHAGLKVRLYDLDPQTMSPQPESLAAAITGKTLCIVVCHFYGLPADMRTVLTLAAERGIPVLDDAAQAMGATASIHDTEAAKGVANVGSGQRKAGTAGTLGLFSMSRGKTISAVDGGILVTDDERLARALTAMPLRSPSVLRQMKTAIMALVLCFFLHPRLYWIPAGLPWLRLGESHFAPEFAVAGLTAFQAALGRRMLARLPDINARRRAVAALWRSRLKGDGAGCIAPLPDTEPVWLRVPVMEQAEALQEFGIVRGYPQSLDALDELKPHRRGNGPYPGAALLAEKLMTLPTHCYVTEAAVDEAVQAMRKGRAA
ncbi:hypothetical protein DSM19430T_19790 [Desulfovibrio psychrotolerans]|uniref:Aminotransferase DegT n=2 Tax=Desulfovibrio psychrotolerans TaxID=415242 RepID=A0A7J0BVV0_9BACT|nr:hypothetical protein DSM19430T_19790 [Desulfovibrio psychrotolerans]